MRPCSTACTRRLRERLDVDEPLIGEQRLEHGVAAIAARHGELMRLDALDETLRLEVGEHRARARRSGRARGRAPAPSSFSAAAGVMMLIMGKPWRWPTS